MGTKMAASPNSRQEVSMGGNYPCTTAIMAMSQLSADTQIHAGLEAVNASGLFEADDKIYMKKIFCKPFISPT